MASLARLACLVAIILSTSIMNSFRAIFTLVAFLLLFTFCMAAPKAARQMDPDVDVEADTPSARGPKNFIQTIFDMIKSILGMDRTTIIREDGTVEEIGGNNGFLARIGKRIMNMISSLMQMITGGGGDSGNFRLDLSNFPKFSKVSADDIERELSKLKLPSS